MLDIKIINGKVIDAEARCLKEVEVGIKDGKIVSLGKGLPDAAQVIDAKGHMVSAGFIDIHMHEENFALTKKKEWDIADCMLRMGVTTGITGSCGSNRQWTFELEEFIQEKGNPINYMGFIGHNFLRSLVGNNDSKAESSPGQIEQMARMVRDAVDDGAIGVSYGIEYATGMTFAEEVGICKYIKGRRELLLSAHYRDDGDKAIDSIHEMAALCREIDIPFEISHLSSCSALGYMKESLDLIEKYRNSGLDLSVDSYPYNAFSTTIGSDVFLPDCFEHWGVGPETIELTDEPYQNMRCTWEIYEDARKNYPYMYAVAHVMREDEIAMAAGHPMVIVASDGVYRNHKGHPRGAGTFPRFLGKYVRDEKVCDFYTGIKKITTMPADRVRMGNRKGRIREGFDADITIFDYDTIIDRSTFSDPQVPPDGIDWVIVNGKVALEGKNIIDHSCGEFIRRP